jgi:hypothetical protein
MVAEWVFLFRAPMVPLVDLSLGTAGVLMVLSGEVVQR